MSRFHFFFNSVCKFVITGFSILSQSFGQKISGSSCFLTWSFSFEIPGFKFLDFLIGFDSSLLAVLNVEGILLVRCLKIMFEN